MRWIKFEVYPRKGVIHVVQVPSIVQEHWEERNLKDKLLLVNLERFSSSESVNNQNDYNRCINLPFVYQLTSLKYHELVEDWDEEDNYDLNILEWANENYPRTCVYDDA